MRSAFGGVRQSGGSAIANNTDLRTIEPRAPPSARREFGIGSYYGIPSDLPDAERGDIYLPAAKGWEPHFATPETAAAWIMDTLRAQGIVETETQAA